MSDELLLEEDIFLDSSYEPILSVSCDARFPVRIDVGAIAKENLFLFGVCHINDRVFDNDVIVFKNIKYYKDKKIYLKIMVFDDSISKYDFSLVFKISEGKYHTIHLSGNFENNFTIFYVGVTFKWN